MVTSLDSWGSNLTLVGGIETMRIDIVVSESGKGSFDDDSTKKARALKQQNKSSKLHGKFDYKYLDFCYRFFFY